MRAPEFPWVERFTETVDLDEADVLYENELPMSDLQVAQSGATCCLRRTPGRAEVIAWEGTPAGPPASWTASLDLPLVALFGFTAQEVYGRTESALMLIRPGHVELLYETRNQIGFATVSPDREHIIWNERKPARLCTMRSARGARVHKAPLPSDCADVHGVWLSDDEVIGCLLHSTGLTETGTSVCRFTADLKPNGQILETRAWLVRLMIAASPSAFFIHGAPKIFPGAGARPSYRPRSARRHGW